jgi:hypothetical protein
VDEGGLWECSPGSTGDNSAGMEKVTKMAVAKKGIIFSHKK